MNLLRGSRLWSILTSSSTPGCAHKRDIRGIEVQYNGGGVWGGVGVEAGSGQPKIRAGGGAQASENTEAEAADSERGGEGGVPVGAFQVTVAGRGGTAYDKRPVAGSKHGREMM
jgi:hypothetical protein